MVSFTHELNIICSQTLGQTQLDDIGHEQTIICRQLFAGHVMGFRPMKRKKILPRMIIIFIFLRFLKQFETLILHLNLPCLIKNIARIIIIFNANWPCIISFLAAYVEVSLIHESRIFGRIFLGPTATGNQFEHWNEMRINNKPIARWHKLLD